MNIMNFIRLECKLASDDREVVIDLPELREMLEWKVRALAYNR